MTTERQYRRLPRIAVAVAVPVAILISSGLVVQASRAASTASLDSAANGWLSGKVVLGADQTSSALFTATDVMPGDSGTRCVNVVYDGNVAANVRMWAETSGPLASSLLVTVEEGTGGGAASCVGFTAPTTLFGPAPLAQLGADHHDAASGLSTWSPAANQSRTYRLTWSLPIGSGSVGESANATFRWDATQA